VCVTLLLMRCCGPPFVCAGAVHGGCIALCFDEIIPFLMLVHERIGFTSSLSIRYLALLPCPSVIQFSCRITSQEGKTMRTEARMLSLQPRTISDGGRQAGDAAHQLYATCEGVFVHSLALGDPFAMARAARL
jgi:acyl-coenzyme A thioesterase PaaI-like protein